MSRGGNRASSRGWDAIEIGVGADARLPAVVGSELTPSDILAGYRRGLFPWPPGDDETKERVAAEIQRHLPLGEIQAVDPLVKVDGTIIPWYAPLERGVLPFDRVHIPRRLRDTIRQMGWTTTMNREFDEVIDRCAQRDGRESWIVDTFRRSYRELHRSGHAHSVEVWAGEELVGGAFGIATGSVFTGESSFFLRSDASKVAILDLAARVSRAGAPFLDVQVLEPPTVRLGAEAITRDRFVELLEEMRDRPLDLNSSRIEARSILDEFHG